MNNYIIHYETYVILWIDVSILMDMNVSDWTCYTGAQELQSSQITLSQIDVEPS